MLNKLENKLSTIQNEKEVVTARIKQSEQRLLELGGAEEIVKNMIEEEKQEQSRTTEEPAVYQPM